MWIGRVKMHVRTRADAHTCASVERTGHLPMLESSLLIASLSQAQLHAAVEPLCRRRTEKRAGRGHGRDHQHRQRPRAECRDAATAQAVLAGHQRSDSRPCFWCVLELLHAKKNRLRRLVNYHYNNLKWGLVITGNYPVITLPGNYHRNYQITDA